MNSEVKRILSVFTVLFAWLTLLPSCFAEMAVLPPPTQDIYLVDDANMVNAADRAQILAMGRELDQKTKAQVIVVTMSTLGSESIEDYSNKLFRKWGIGDRKKKPKWSATEKPQSAGKPKRKNKRRWSERKPKQQRFGYWNRIRR